MYTKILSRSDLDCLPLEILEHQTRKLICLEVDTPDEYLEAIGKMEDGLTEADGDWVARRIVISAFYETYSGGYRRGVQD